MARKRRPRQKQQPALSKSPSQAYDPARGKQPRSPVDPTESRNRSPVWKIGMFDVDGPWGREKLDFDTLINVIFPKLRDYESMPWGGIEKDRAYNHHVLTNRLIKKARDRLVKFKLDDVDELFRFRVSGKQRIWGIREFDAFKILWWDPDHEVCPSGLKHT